MQAPHSAQPNYFDSQNYNVKCMSRPLPSDWTKRRREVLRRDDYMCRHCERHEEMRGVSLEVHHIVPRSRGGSHEKYNLVTMCQHCHDRTHNGNVRTPDDHLAYIDRLKEEVRSFQWRHGNITDIDPRSIAKTVAGSLPDPASIKNHTSLRNTVSDPPPRTFPNFILDVGKHVTEREASCAE
ncbi:HNH endonuclease [Haloplanus ruber]|uniref:HNH endonuclease n=1 Tax=Haloplanus ruber TaxID=869892 RepID=A0ABD6D3P4_9EURY